MINLRKLQLLLGLIGLAWLVACEDGSAPAPRGASAARATATGVTEGAGEEKDEEAPRPKKKDPVDQANAGGDDSDATGTETETDGEGGDGGTGTDSGEGGDGEAGVDGASDVGDVLTEQKVEPYTDAEVIEFFKTYCVNCHSANDGTVKSFWALDPALSDVKSILTDTMAPTVYYSLVMRVKNIVGGKPSAMPPKNLSEENQAKVARAVAWFNKEGPAAVAEANARYGAGGESEGGGVGVVLNFKCETPATFREYLRRVTNDAFGREPTAAELALNGKDGPDVPATEAHRTMIGERLFDPAGWQAEFVDKGLKKFAAKLSGASDITPLAPDLTPEAADDLKQEFYQILKANFDSKSFQDILLSDKTMVTARTAPLYGCTAPTVGDWGECTMTAPRGTYFTTLSYLRSKQSSFLVENNNYGRAALMYFVIRGDVFKAAFNQGGGDTVRALPDCLSSIDFRGTQGTTFAPYGSMAVPSSANLCQSCHIQRQMASGSILFRPYDKIGLTYNTTTRLVSADPDFAAATSTEHRVLRSNGGLDPVNADFLNRLLTDTNEKACVPGEQGDADIPLATVGDLARYLIGDGVVLPGGLARHLPRAFSNLNNTSEELIIAVNKAFKDHGGKLGPIMKAYFASETYACQKR